MKLKYFLKRKLNIHTSYLILIALTTVLIIGGYFSYALFTASNESKGALNIVTGNLYALIKSDDLDSDKEVVLTPNETKVISMDLVNVNGREAKLNLYYSSTSSNIEIGYLKSGDEAPTQAGVVLGANGSDTERKSIKVRITNYDTENVVISFGADAGLATAELAFPSDKMNLNKLENNVIVAYAYNEGKTAETEATKCITGEESTCQKTTCYQDATVGICPVGTIIKYMVNDTTMKYFYVLHDDGATMTLQARENTIDNTVWYTGSAENPTPVPLILSSLDTVTNAWNNVNDQTYTMGSTIFKDNAYTGCDAGDGTTFSCSTNAYTLTEVTKKARMITIQEAYSLGCNALGTGSCPIWMYNYLYNSTSNGGSVDSDNTNNLGYWTLNMDLNGNNTWYVGPDGKTLLGYPVSANYGARAVVVINKEVKSS